MGWLLIHHACWNHNIALTKLLLRHGALISNPLSYFSLYFSDITLNINQQIKVSLNKDQDIIIDSNGFSMPALKDDPNIYHLFLTANIRAFPISIDERDKDIDICSLGGFLKYATIEHIKKFDFCNEKRWNSPYYKNYFQHSEHQ